jgi:hypothetical protein
MCAAEGYEGDDYYGLRRSTLWSWANRFRGRQGIRCAPVRKEYQLSKPADEIFRSIRQYWQDAFKFHKETLLKAQPDPAKTCTKEHVVYVNLDEVGFGWLPTKKALMPDVMPAGQSDMPVAYAPAAPGWRYSAGLAATSRSDFVVRPFICIDNGTMEDSEAAYHYCRRNKIVFSRTACTSLVVRDWARQELLPAWQSFVARKAAEKPEDKGRWRLVLLMDNASVHTAYVKNNEEFFPGVFARYLAPYTTFIMQQVDFVTGRCAKEAVRGMGAFGETLIGSLITVLAVFEVDQRKHNSYKLFRRTGTDWKLDDPIPAWASLHRRFRAWAEESDHLDALQQPGTDPLPEELAETKRNQTEITQLINCCKKEGVSIKGVRSAWVGEMMDDWMKAPMWQK